MIGTPIPETLDWVTGRAKCSLYNMFKSLEAGAREDVEKMNSLLTQHDQVRFSIVPSNKQFSVTRVDDPITAMMAGSVDFLYLRDHIKVKRGNNDGDEELFIATITFTNEGRCKLKVKDVELEQWQVRRMALEKLFFKS